MFTSAKIIKLLAILLVTSVLSACGGSSVNKGEVLLTCNVPMVPDATGASCVAPKPIQCPAPTVPDALNESCVVGVDPNAPAPLVFPAENETILYYQRNNVGASNASDDPSYNGYRLHTWNDATCDAYDTPYDSSDWANGHQFDGIDPNYGAYWIIKLKADHSDCGNFIVHIGTDGTGKALGDGDLKMPLAQDDATYQRMNFTFHGQSDVFEYPLLSLGKQPLQVKDFAAHWLDAKTFVWQIDSAVITSVKLHHLATAGIAADENDVVNGATIDLTATELTDAQKAAAPLVADWPAFSADIDEATAKSLLKEQQVLVGYNSNGEAVAATNVQNALALDALYTRNDADADEASLGVIYNDAGVLVKVWSPTAQSVKLNLFAADKTQTSSVDMTEDSVTGIWSYQGDNSLDRQFYQFELRVYHPQTQAIETIISTDPYSLSLSTNGEYSQFVNLNDADLKPQGWDEQQVVVLENLEDAVIYEGHIRDFSAQDESTSVENRGKYMAFTELDSMPMQHLQQLKANGLTNFHILPANDIASINEDSDKVVNITDTVADLCALNANAPVCGVEDSNATIKSVLENYNSFSNDAANLMNAMRGYDSFNWGYDPKHFNVPDGSYSSNPDGVARIKEMRAMVESLHSIGLRVILDVVYNHTNSAGLYDNSVFDKVVPGYYYSRDLITGNVKQSTCCNDTALEHRMMDKFMDDSLVMWAQQYDYDGFRFDIMSHGSKEQMLAAREAVRTVDVDTQFYGEGWGREYRGFTAADQVNMAGTEISTFNDRLRDGVRSAQLFSNNSTEDGPFIQQDIIKLGMAGTLADYILKDYNGVSAKGSAFNPSMYAKDPADVINYVSKHDDESLWDKLQFNLPFAMSLNERVRAQNVSQAIVLLSQGVPFLQMGSDFLRSKSLDANTYDAGDWYNKVDFTLNRNNWNVGLPLEKRGRSDDELVSLASSPLTSASASDMDFASKVFDEFLKIRSTSKLFRLTTAEDIMARVGFHNIGKRQTQGLIVMSIDDGTGLTDLDPNVDAIVVVVNGSNQEQSHTVATASGFTLHSVQANSVDNTVQGASFTAGDNEGTFTVPALTTAVFVKAQGDVQGAGLAATATSGAPDVVPYGATTVFVRGGMNGWGEVDALDYKGAGIYQVAITLAAGNYEFKLASSDWSTVNLGAPAGDNQVDENELQPLLPNSNDNLNTSIAIDGTYIFSLDASNTASPILTIKNEEPFIGTPIFIRGGMNGWGEVNELAYIGGGQYSVTFNIDAGTQDFKIASGDWSTVNMGAPSNDKEVFIGENQLLVSGSNDNLTMTFPTTGEYTFIFNASNLAEPTLSVYSAKMFGDTAVFIRGGMNGWSENDPLVYQGNGVYSVDLILDAASYDFKVASSDWATFNLGGNSNGNVVNVDSAYQLVQGSNDNLSLTVNAAGTYTFTVVGPNPETAKVTVSKK
ncbi:MAG: DUF3372 domain-containing protein [Alteromonadaceae bacterium]|nr:DUF3372 domain-containing protein [Alteromonadaceae bacterium]